MCLIFSNYICFLWFCVPHVTSNKFCLKDLSVPKSLNPILDPGGGGDLPLMVVSLIKLRNH